MRERGSGFESRRLPGTALVGKDDEQKRNVESSVYFLVSIIEDITDHRSYRDL